MKPDDWSDLPDAARVLSLSNKKIPTHDWMKKEARWQQAVKAYLACVRWTDEQIGRVLNALDAGPHAGNTEIEWITLQVIGPPENLHTFRVLSQVSLDLWTSDEEAAVKIATACLIASRIIGLEDQEVPDWAGEVLVRWFDRPQPSHVEST